MLGIIVLIQIDVVALCRHRVIYTLHARVRLCARFCKQFYDVHAYCIYSNRCRNRTLVAHVCMHVLFRAIMHATGEIKLDIDVYKHVCVRVFAISVLVHDY